jgi:hypothetical protein
VLDDVAVLVEELPCAVLTLMASISATVLPSSRTSSVSALYRSPHAVHGACTVGRNRSSTSITSPLQIGHLPLGRLKENPAGCSGVAALLGRGKTAADAIEARMRRHLTAKHVPCLWAYLARSDEPVIGWA